MKQRELARLHVLNNVLEYQIPIGQAAEVLGVSERHARRLLNAYRKEGAAALAHGNRGRQPHNASVRDEEANEPIARLRLVVHRAFDVSLCLSLYDFVLVSHDSAFPYSRQST